ncbi:hypothetical protein cypCar_00011437 [Cyprinus carpio]|nr:hypothetical protein cypCar_00011437 [Cyprinus carpio]
MERNRGGTTAGFLVWTPAPAYSSPSSPDELDFSWDEEPDEDFQSQMNENGIIGLAESQGQQEGEEEEIAEGLLWDVKTPEPEHGPPPALEEISCHLSELLDSEPLSQATGDDCCSPSLRKEVQHYKHNDTQNDTDCSKRLKDEAICNVSLSVFNFFLSLLFSQEDYNRLLTKYAEAENTIDRLRLEAKVGFTDCVGLCSEPPKPSTAILSGVIQEGSKVITLNFPQAQRAEFNAVSAQLAQQKDHSDIKDRKVLILAFIVSQSPLSAAHPEACVGVEVSSVSGESDADREEEEILPFLLHPLYDKHQHVGKDFCKLMDWQAAADCVPPSGPSVRSQVCDSMETHPEALCHASVLPGQLSRERKAAGNRKTQSSSLTSLAERTEPRTMGLKAKAKTVRASPLDGVKSQETDSGFMGSELSQLTPAVHSPLQQRAVVRGEVFSSSIRPSGPHTKNIERPESAPPSRQPFAVSPSCSQPSSDTPGELIKSEGCTGPVRRRGGEEGGSSSSLSPSISSIHWPSSALLPWPSSLTSQSEHGSDQGDEKAQDGQYAHPANQQIRSHSSSPSLHVPYHHGDHLEAQSSVQLTNQQEALQSLQREVNRLKERLEGNLRLSKPASPVRVPTSATEDARDQASPRTARSSDRRRRQTERVRNEEQERGNSTRRTLKQKSVSLPQHRPQTDLSMFS